MKIKNKPIDLNNILMEQLERLNDPDISGDALASEIERSKAIKDVASAYIANNNSIISACRLHAEYAGGSAVTELSHIVKIEQKNEQT